MQIDDSRPSWDVVIIGGALSGSATACLLMRRNPRLKILILERNERFARRVGESTVEISAYFLGRVLGLTEYLNQEHLVKQGLRFWFTNDRVQNLGQCSETGPGYNVRFPGYQVDRSLLDEEVLRRAAGGGAQVRRGVRVRDVDLMSGGVQTIFWEDDAGNQGSEQARWVVDGSGVSALLARKNHWHIPNAAHPIASIWSRWRGVKNWDDPDLAAKFPDWGNRTKAVRFTATNHLVGYGWWGWWIPLKGGDFSIGIVFDQRLIDLPPGEKLGERLRTMLSQHPAAQELLTDATWQEGDVHFRRNLAYHSRHYAGHGFVLVGDAAAFMDPFYSAGLDWISYSATAAAALIDDCCRGKPAAPRVQRHNERFSLSYERWFDAVYRDKYFYLGDHELMTIAFRLDLGLYYLGVVSQAIKGGASALELPSFASSHARHPAKLISFYNRRLVKIARSRRARGTWGRHNDRHYYGFTSYELNALLLPRILKALGEWLWLEVREGWRSWFRPPADLPELPLHPTRRPASLPAGAASNVPESSALR